MKKRIVGILLMLCLLLTMMVFPVSAASNSGPCGTGVYYEYNPGTQTLRIYGSGKMLDFKYYDVSVDPFNPWAKFDVKTLKIESGVQNIGSYAFYAMRSITDVSIADSVQEIGEGAFLSCYGIEELKLPANLKTVGIRAFAKTDITEITIPASLTEIQAEVFCRCTDLEKVTILGDIQSIGSLAFYNCENLREVIFETGSAKCGGVIGEQAFAYCEELEQFFLLLPPL